MTVDLLQWAMAFVGMVDKMNDLQALEKKLETAESDRDSISAKQEQLERDLSAVQSEHEATKEEAQASSNKLESEKSRLAWDLMIAQSEHDTAKQSLVRYAAALEQAQGSRNKLEQDKRLLQQGRDQLRQDLATAQIDLDAKNTTLASKTTALEEVQLRSEKPQADLSKSQNDQEETRKTLSTMTNALHESQTFYTKLREEKDLLDSDLKARDFCIKSLEDDLKGELLGNHVRMVAELRAKNTDLQTMKVELQTKDDELKKQVTRNCTLEANYAGLEKISKEDRRDYREELRRHRRDQHVQAEFLFGGQLGEWDSLMDAMLEEETDAAIDGHHRPWVVLGTWNGREEQDEDYGQQPIASVFVALVSLCGQGTWSNGGSQFLALMCRLTEYLATSPVTNLAVLTWIIQRANIRVSMLPTGDQVPACAAIWSLADTVAVRWNQTHLRQPHSLLEEYLLTLQMPASDEWVKLRDGNDEIHLVRSHTQRFAVMFNLADYALWFVDSDHVKRAEDFTVTFRGPSRAIMWNVMEDSQNFDHWFKHWLVAE
ncbi:uncharacterized protein ColSpa_09605 [Colletotrichum spaethianum]|uniref:Uncharacterized protein n=1 Tax=Colletotrichum spaethianum TaxID=700344 RepID=A0AA37UJB6_9PEZI|nr:uncharacterized protein ColSpa_09605 [Colletotrichum spaethianum]GKT49424.1 hypothetical protein ColSpa_09605 [Colletotrichum spaethianum]